MTERCGEHQELEQYIIPPDVGIEGLEVTEAILRAVREHGLDELRASGDDIAPIDAFMLGLRAGVEVMRKVAEVRDAAGTDEAGAAAGNEDGEKAEPRLADWIDVAKFAKERGYPPKAGHASKLRIGLMARNLRRRDDPVTPLVKALWSTRPSETGEQWPIDTVDLDVALELTRELVVNRGYTKENAASTFKTVGPYALSLLADFLNVRLGLEGEERLPLFVQREGA